MSVDIERELLDVKDLALENNKILKSLQRKSRISFWFAFFKWALIFLVAFGIYTFIKPIIDQLIVTYNTLTESVTAISEIKSNIPDNSLLKDLFNKR
ncbi:MAG TPA: hypothetical protein PJ997_00740 [Candidatus Paceibacterota bacterium]|nr:hypothetical protein [Candidatus Paceibacterota bacterium]HMP18850.1 hypothetical protein [Candidatus Paceibacterota bacterium]